MKCPTCDKEMTKGVIKSTEAGSLTNMMVLVSWTSDEQMKKRFGREGVFLERNAIGYYCDVCHKAYAIYEKE